MTCFKGCGFLIVNVVNIGYLFFILTFFFGGLAADVVEEEEEIVMATGASLIGFSTIGGRGGDSSSVCSCAAALERLWCPTVTMIMGCNDINGCIYVLSFLFFSE